MSELQRYREAAARQAIRAEKAEATIAQQQARIDELKLALDKADPLDPSFLRYLELEQQLQAERERAEKAEGMVQWWKEEARHMEDVLQAEQHKVTNLTAALADFVVARETWMNLVEAQAQTIAALDRQLERHTRLLHIAVHNWALHSVVDCPELECEEYRALFSPAPEEK